MGVELEAVVVVSERRILRKVLSIMDNAPHPIYCHAQWYFVCMYVFLQFYRSGAIFTVNSNMQYTYHIMLSHFDTRDHLSCAITFSLFCCYSISHSADTFIFYILHLHN